VDSADQLNPDFRFFICSKGSVTDLEEIYCITQCMPGYGEHEGQWRFKAIARLDGKPLDFIYASHEECLAEQRRMAEGLVAFRTNRAIVWE